MRGMKKVIEVSIIFFILNVISNLYLQDNIYEMVSTKINEPFRIVLLSDLHNREYGENNSNLIEKIEESSPDIIVIVGDMNLSDEKDNHVLVELCEKLYSIAPTYYSLGNHELAVKETGTLLQDIAKTDVQVLDNKWEEISVKSNQVVIGGITEFPKSDLESREFINDFQKQNEFKLLLCHYPEFYLWGMENWNVDLILSGHAHGGLIRLPFLGGLWAPEQGWFPKYEEGMHCAGINTMIVSRGLGTSSKIPRFNNPPEIAVINLVSD